MLGGTVGVAIIGSAYDTLCGVPVVLTGWRAAAAASRPRAGPFLGGHIGCGDGRVRHRSHARVSGAPEPYSPVWSSTSAPGALVLTDSIPASADCLRS